MDSEDSEDSDGEGQPKAKVRKVCRGDVAEAGKKKSKSKGPPTISSSTLANVYFPPADLQECASSSSSDGSSSSDNSPSPDYMYYLAILVKFPTDLIRFQPNYPSKIFQLHTF